MGIRKSLDEKIVVTGNRKAILTKAIQALNQSGFSGIKHNKKTCQIDAKKHTITVFGDIRITLIPLSKNATEIDIHATSNIDNIYALFISPNKKIIDTFKDALTQLL